MIVYNHWHKAAANVGLCALTEKSTFGDYIMWMQTMKSWALAQNMSLTELSAPMFTSLLPICLDAVLIHNLTVNYGIDSEHPVDFETMCGYIRKVLGITRFGMRSALSELV